MKRFKPITFFSFNHQEETHLSTNYAKSCWYVMAFWLVKHLNFMDDHIVSIYDIFLNWRVLLYLYSSSVSVLSHYISRECFFRITSSPWSLLNLWFGISSYHISYNGLWFLFCGICYCDVIKETLKLLSRTTSRGGEPLKTKQLCLVGATYNCRAKLRCHLQYF